MEQSDTFLDYFPHVDGDFFSNKNLNPDFQPSVACVGAIISLD